MSTETPDERAERLLGVAVDLAVRVRDEDPAAVARHVAAFPPGELPDLVVILAALVPDDRPVSELLAWWLEPAVAPPAVRLRPCGTRAAYARHLAHRERPCRACRAAAAAYRRQRRLTRRAS